ncbi:MAG: class D sortase [Turicibacter sp.]|nr:class D sortase [Turicibacter sp.]
MRKWFASLLIVTGIICCMVAIYPIFEMGQKVNDSLNEWEDMKVQYEESEEEVVTVFETSSLIGTMQIANYEPVIPIHKGTSDEILKKGIGLDEATVYLGEAGNSVLYGHREQIFWNLKYVEVGDLIKIETLDQVLTFKVSEIQVVDPLDSFIYEQAEEPTITLVTCSPFIYMGPTPERYVVKAILSN